MDPLTEVLRFRIDDGDARPAVTPLYQASAFEAGSPYFYTRKSNPNIAELEEVVRRLEGTAHAVAVSTGMAAVKTCLDLLRPGDGVVINRLVYGCSFKLFQRVAAQYGLDLHVLDLTTAAGIDALPPATRMVFFETPTNPYLRTVDIAAVVERVRRTSPGAVVVVDNTWASPLFQRPVALGADVSLHSATKYLSGHSDVMGGVLLTNRADLADAFRATRFYGGAVLDPHAAWLLRRSTQTLALRLRHQAEVTAWMRDFLGDLPQVERVYYPDVDGRQLTGYGGILFFQLRRDLTDGYERLASRVRCFGTGTGMACVTSMIAQPYSGSHASMSDDEKAAIGLGRGLVRLCFGLESRDDLAHDLRDALAALD